MGSYAWMCQCWLTSTMWIQGGSQKDMQGAIDERDRGKERESGNSLLLVDLKIYILCETVSLEDEKLLIHVSFIPLKRMGFPVITSYHPWANLITKTENELAFTKLKDPSEHGPENTPTAFLQRSKNPTPNECPDMTLYNLMVRFQ